MKKLSDMISQICRLITKFEWLILLLILPITFFSPGRLTLLLLLLPILLVCRRIAVGYFFPKTPFDVAFLLLLLMVLVSFYATFDIWLSAAKIVGVSVAFYLFYTAVSFTRQQTNGIWYLLAFFLLVALGFAVLGLLGTTWPAPFSFLNRIKNILPIAQTGLLGTDNIINPNFLAGSLVMAAPLALACFLGFARSFWQKQKIWMVCLGLISLFLAGVIIATGSRGGLLALACALLVMFAVRYKWGWVLLSAVIIAGIGLLIYLDLPDIFISAQSSTDVGINGRLEIWSRSILAIHDFPFTGISMNGFPKVIPELYPFFLLAGNNNIPHAHNHLLQAGLDLGIPGLIAYLSVWLIALGSLWQSWRRRTNQQQQVWLIGLSGSLAAAWVFGIFDAIGLGERPGFVWWLLLALITAVLNDTWQQSPRS